jgi:flagellar motor protein MotB
MNMKKRANVFSLFLSLILFATFPNITEALSEHPLIRPFPGSKLEIGTGSIHQNFNAYNFKVGTPSNYQELSIKGEYRKLNYTTYKNDGSRNTDVSRLEYIENYKNAAFEIGGEVKFESARELVFTVPREDGGITWCIVTSDPHNGRHYLIIVDEKPLITILEFGPAQMKSALDAEGKVILYGILFDYDKATLQHSSNKQLQDVLMLLLEAPELSLEIQGHTDSDGSAAYNLELSQRRSESVLTYLVLFGVDHSRLQAKGHGESKPVAPNDTDENKAKNRRVELVRLDR